MDSVVFESVSKSFRHRPALFNWIGKEKTGETCALSEISLRIPCASVIALLGPNGSGKTTLLKLIATILLPDAGRILIDGSDTRFASHVVRQRVGFAMASERSFFPRLTARENLDLFAALEDVPRSQRKIRISQVLEDVDLLNAADTLAMKFSSGMYQRLAIARALLKQPTILLLDEPSRSLDPESAIQGRSLIRRLRSTGTTILLATHNLEEAASVADSVIVLRDGRVIATQKLVSSNAEDLSSLYREGKTEPEPILEIA